MQEPTRIIAIRHGETDWNVQGRIQGHQDVELNATGLRQARRLAQALRRETVGCIYSSDLQRALQTAQALAQTTGAPLVTEPRLRERSFGRYEGLRFMQVQTEAPEHARRWRERDPHYAPEGGENLSALRQRIAATVDELAARHAGEQIVLVAHGGVMDMLYRLATRQHLQAARTWQLPNAAVNRLLWNPGTGLTLVGWADTGHLAADSRDEQHD
ncbi:histidine phosphatase family protein [Comamonas flocculans]|uniref:Histidine phosphatase family protein n=1 Tax=Comamonas flocculans TaxID=2597701 RepID=A0A5B8RST6_9BURK|nr:histidine phosphatase family protein [Comamonas flocculans]QEA12550.1 histidine phosphatase family protein [Comamonas flocculans]